MVTAALIQKEDAQQMKSLKEQIELEKLTSSRSSWCYSKGIHHPLPPNLPLLGLSGLRKLIKEGSKAIKA